MAADKTESNPKARSTPDPEPEPKPIADPFVEDDTRHATLDFDLMVRLWSYLVPYKWPVLMCLGLSAGFSGLKILQPIFIHHTIENEIQAGDERGLALKMLLFAGLIAVTFGCEVLFNWTTGVVGQKSMHDLRMKLFRHVSHLDVRFFDRTPVGRLVTRMTSDVQALNDLFSSGVVAIFADTMMLAGLIGVMFYFSPPLTVIVVCAIPFMLGVVTLFRRYSRRWFLEARSRLAVVNTFLQENITGMSTVQTLRREAKNFEQFSALNDDYRHAQIHTIMAFAMFFPALNLILYVTLTSVIWFAGKAIPLTGIGGEGAIGFGTLFLFIQCIHMLFAPMRSLSEKYNLLQSAMASSSRIFRLSDIKPQIASGPDSREPEEFSDAIRFENVDFEYVEGEPVLKDVSLELRRGQTVAVVGATGSGKSTLVNLMMRFYDVNAGKITIDGHDIRDLSLESLRRKFAVVLQEVFLFSDTIAGNIRLVDPSLTDDDVWRLLREVDAEDFVRNLADGIDTQVGERAANFSTGQKQLFAFARALAADPEILVLDEATANVDTATELRIQHAIERLLKDRTALVIAHRISTIRKADLIIVMHKGRIRESGSHDELMAQAGLYSRLYQLQFQIEDTTESLVEQAS